MFVQASQMSRLILSKAEKPFCIVLLNEFAKGLKPNKALNAGESADSKKPKGAVKAHMLMSGNSVGPEHKERIRIS